MIFLTAEVLSRAGARLTTSTWAGAFASLGSYQGPYFPSSSFRAGKFDGADQVQALRYQSGNMAPVSGFTGSF